MHLKIRGKFIAILLVAAAVPLLVALLSVELIGRRYVRKNHAEMFQLHARGVASAIVSGLERNIGGLQQRIHFSSLSAFAAGSSRRAMTAPDEQANAARIADKWQDLPIEAPEVQAVLDNEAARELQRYCQYNPVYARMLVTDCRGAAIAATNKPDVYRQNSAPWWKDAMHLPIGSVLVSPAMRDPKSGAYMIPVTIPLGSNGSEAGPPAGVLRAYISCPVLFSSVQQILSSLGPTRQVVAANGEVIYSFFSDRQPGPRQLSPEATRFLNERPLGWARVDVDGNGADIVAFAPLRPMGEFVHPAVTWMQSNLSIAVYEEESQALQAVWKQLWLLVGAGAVLMVVFGVSGFLLANRRIIVPLATLRRAARTVSAEAQLDGESAASGAARRPSETPAQIVRQVQSIRTEDEIGDLAKDFVRMSERVLHYHEQMRAEIAEKTAEIHSDLEFAREFQEALMGRDFPSVFTNGTERGMRLNFHHIYQPASSVSGDFFSVVQLGDGRVGVLIADVMGHGARSALITAIMATLFNNLAPDTDDPAVFLRRINRNFWKIVHQTHEMVFVTAFYMIVDVPAGAVRYASAGHPSPFLASRNDRCVVPLVWGERHGPAIGLFPEHNYTTIARPLKASEVFMLFTDGLFEATNSNSEEFGIERLRDALQRHMHVRAHDLDHAVMGDLMEFTGPRALDDDICLISIEVESLNLAVERHEKVLEAVV